MSKSEETGRGSWLVYVLTALSLLLIVLALFNNWRELV